MTTEVFADDADATATFTVTDADGQDLDWDPVEVAVDDGEYEVAAEWLGDPSASRRVQVPVDTLEPGTYRLYLKIPGANDVRLGSVIVKARV